MVKRVLMFGWELPPHNSGGLGVACNALAKAISTEGIGVLFVLPKRIEAEADFMQLLFADNGGHIAYRTMPSSLTPYITSEDYRRRNYSFNGLYGENLFAEVERYAMRASVIARQEMFDVIHAHDWLSFPAGLAARTASGKPLVVHVHATEFDRTGGNAVNQHVYEIERAGMQAADAVIAVSKYTKHMVQEKYGIPAEKITVAYNAIDGNNYKAASGNAASAPLFDALRKKGKHIILFVGRLTLQKGPDYFLAAARRVLMHTHDAAFIVAGAGDMQASLVEEACRLGMSEHVHFTGFLRGAELIRAYQMADVFVMSSVSEPFGITPLESLFLGTPVILSRQSGVSEIIKHALRVDFWDTEDMAAKILSLMKYQSIKKTLQEQGAQEVRRLQWKDTARACLDVYNKCVQYS